MRASRLGKVNAPLRAISEQVWDTELRRNERGLREAKACRPAAKQRRGCLEVRSDLWFDGHAGPLLFAERRVPTATIDTLVQGDTTVRAHLSVLTCGR